jgi:hypothetical protein
MFEVIKPISDKKRQQQINALTWQIEHDTSDKDRKIHEQALKLLMDKK